MKKLIVFDLDGTLAESKSKLTPEMTLALEELMKKYMVAVISGGWWPQFEKQFLSQLPDHIDWSRLFIFPTCGSAFYRWEEGKWKNVYMEKLEAEQIEKIRWSINEAMSRLGIEVEKLWGEQIEDRGSQVTISALGQEAPVTEKKLWDPDQKKRRQIKKIMDELIPEFEVRIGGTTSIDVTKKGIDKAYGIRKMEEILRCSKEEMFFVGDALEPGGNDYAVKAAGVESEQVSGPEDTILIIEKLCSVQ